MGFFETVGVLTILIIGILGFVMLVIAALDLLKNKIAVLSGVVEYLIYRKHFHKWRKENKDMNPDGSFPAS